jgi:hypothetical protein
LCADIMHRFDHWTLSNKVQSHFLVIDF